jgi:putative MATE family efflux protein
LKQHSDLTTGSIFQKLIFVALPIMGTQLMQMLYNLTNMFFLGRLSSEAVAAAAASTMFIWLSNAMLLVGRMGAEIGVSQNKGRGDQQKANAFARNAWHLALLLGFAYGSLLMFFSETLLSVINIREPDVASMAADYLRILGLGIPAMYMTAALAGSFNGSGKSQIPFLASAIGTIISVFLNPLMIFTFGFGIQGAAIATILAQWLVFALLLLAIKKHKERPFEQIKLLSKPNREIIGQIIRWSLPISLESGFFTILTMAVTRLIAGFGSGALAVYHVAAQIESLSWFIGVGFGTAVTAFVGQNYGAEKWDRIKNGFRVSSVTMLIWGTAISLLLVFCGYILFSVFLQEPELRAMGAGYLAILAITQIPGCLEHVGSGFFRGMGRTARPSIVSIITNILRVAACYLLASTALGLVGVWWGVTLTAALRGSVIFGWGLIVMHKNAV